MTPSFETLELTLDENVATVCLNRPDKANSMNGPMWKELQQCFEWLDREPAVRAVVLAGNVAGETRTIPVAVYTLLNVRGGEAAALRQALLRRPGSGHVRRVVQRFGRSGTARRGLPYHGAGIAGQPHRHRALS